MRINLKVTDEQALALMAKADKADLTVDEYICAVLFGNTPSASASSQNVLDLENKLYAAIEVWKDKITKYEKGFVFVSTDIMPYSRQTHAKEEVKVIEREVISQLEVNGIISLYCNSSHPFQYIRN